MTRSLIALETGINFLKFPYILLKHLVMQVSTHYQPNRAMPGTFDCFLLPEASFPRMQQHARFFVAYFQTYLRLLFPHYRVVR